jgi:hypothetical protein
MNILVYLHSASLFIIFNYIVGVATGYTRRLDGRGSIPLLHRVQTGSRAHPASYLICTGVSFPGGKTIGASR